MIRPVCIRLIIPILGKSDNIFAVIDNIEQKPSSNLVPTYPMLRDHDVNLYKF